MLCQEMYLIGFFTYNIKFQSLNNYDIVTVRNKDLYRIGSGKGN